MNMNLSPDDCLEVLQAADGARVWHSLEEERVCHGCGNTITGRQIVILRDQHGHLVLHCPTPGCTAAVDDWFYPAPLSDPPSRNSAGEVQTAEMDFSNW